MTTPSQDTHFRVLTPAMMAEYAKEQEALALKAKEPFASEEEATEEVTPPADVPQQEALSAEELSYKQRWIDGKKFYDENITKERREKDALAAEIKSLKDKLDTQPVKKYASEEDIRKFNEAYTVTPILQQVALDVSQEQIEAGLNKIREELRLKDLEQERINRDVSKLSKTHPDWAELQENDIFLGWLGKQSSTIQRLADYSVNKDIDAAIAVLDMFKAQVQVKKPSGSTKNLSTNPVSSTKADVPAVKEGQVSFAKWEKEYEKHNKLGNRKKQADLMDYMLKAQTEGRLIP